MQVLFFKSVGENKLAYVQEAYFSLVKTIWKTERSAQNFDLLHRSCFASGVFRNGEFAYMACVSTCVFNIISICYICYVRETSETEIAN